MPYDVRAVANFVLDLAAKSERDITNMHINKIVYFLHADFLVSFGRPLVSAKIEAWQHGPVFRELYREFKDFDRAPITTRASMIDPATGARTVATYKFSKEEAAFLEAAAEKYSHLSAAQLRAQSHVRGGPWDEVWNHDTVSNASMKITDEQIKGWHERMPKH